MASEPPPSTSSAAPGCPTSSDQIPAESSAKSVTGAETSDPAAITASSQPSATAVTQQNSATAQNSDKDKEQLSKVLATAPATSHPPQLQQPQTLSAQQQQQQPPPLPSTSPPIQSPGSQGTRPSSPRATAPPTLCINPNKAVFTTAGGVSKHLLINKSADRLAIKIRSSNNFFFRVNPVYSFLDCNAVNELEVIRLIGGGAKHDKLQVIYVTCTENDTDATKLFGLRAKVRSVILPIVTTAA